MLSALLAAGASAGFGFLSQAQSARYLSAMFDKQKAWEEEKMKNSYTWTMEDLQKAGLNPTLMMGGAGSANMAGSSTSGAVGTPSTDVGSTYTSALKMAKELQLMDAQKENIDADTDLKGAQSGKTSAETEFQKIQNKYQDGIVQLDMALKDETNRQIRTDVQEKMQRINAIKKDIEKTEKEIDILKSQGKIAEAEALTRVNNRRGYAILEMLESGTRSVGNVVGAVKGTSALPTHGNMNVNSNSNAVHWYGQ